MTRKRRPIATSGGGGDILLDVLTLPVLGVPRLVYWIAAKVVEEAERQEFDEGKLQAQLLDLQMRLDLGEIDDEDYAQAERHLLDKLNYIRNVKQGD